MLYLGTAEVSGHYLHVEEFRFKFLSEGKVVVSVHYTFFHFW